MRIIGHRGARGEAPENTLGGFQYLHDLGIRAVEFDVRQLPDDSLVVMHDDNLLRTTGHALPLANCTIQHLHHFDQSQHWELWPNFECTPTLAEVLHLLQDFEHIEVEIKSVDTLHAADKIVHTLLGTLLDFQHNVIITSFDLKILTALQEQHVPFQRGLLVETNLGLQAIAIAQQLGCCQIGWMDQLATPELIQASHQAGLNISVWTVNDVARAQELHELGIQGLITDYPKKMLGQL